MITENILEEIKISKSASLMKQLSDEMEGETFHHHQHILYDVRTLLGEKEEKTYLEIGSYNGGSMSLMLQHPYQTKLYCIDPMVATKNQKEILHTNLKRFNKHGRKCSLLQHFSQDLDVLNSLREQEVKIDIIFIDGDHAEKAVYLDFFLYLEFLNDTGVVLFDDYNDFKYSPGVKPAVDKIENQVKNYFHVIKNFCNFQGAYDCLNLKQSNECIFQKFPPKVPNVPKVSQNMKPAIVMATYNRKNNSSLKYLERSIGSVISQTYQEWTLIIVSDDYENKDELLNLINIFRNRTQNEIVLIENKVCERNYVTHPHSKWKVAGAIAMNMGLLHARQEGYTTYLHLDDDDYWGRDHVQTIMEQYDKYENCIFVNTKSVYQKRLLPSLDMKIYPNNYIPTGGKMIHSSFSFRLDVLPYYYFTSLDNNTKREPADSQMLNSIGQYLKRHPEYCSIYVPRLTCFHEEERQN